MKHEKHNLLLLHAHSILKLYRTAQFGELSDPLARIDGLLNAIVIQTDTPQEVTVIGPGAGRFQAGQGMLADLIAIAKSR